MQVSRKLIENVGELKKALNEISVYDFDVYTSMELYYKIANKLNEVIKELMRFEGLVSDEVIKQNEKLIYLLGEGLNIEVVKKINQMVADGTMDTIINHNVFNSINDKIENYKEELSSQIKDVEDYLNNGKRKVKPLICNNLWFINRNEQQMINMINNQLKMGIEGFVICFHLTLDQTKTRFNISENVESTLRVVQHFREKGVYFSAIKFHCTDGELSTNTDIQNLYKSCVLNIANMFLNLEIKHCVVLNERNDMFTDNNLSYMNDLVYQLKQLGYKVSINANSRNTILINKADYPQMFETYDFISCNMYPSISAKGRNTTLQDCKNAWESETRFNGLLSNQKKFILTETGMRPYWNYFASPARYEYDYEYEYDINAQLLYLEGVFSSAINDLASEIWLWFFPENYNEKVENLIRSFTNKGGFKHE